MKTCGGSGGIAPPFLTSELDECEWSPSRPDRFTPGKRILGTHWIGGWVGPTAGEEAGNRTPAVQPVAIPTEPSQLLHRIWTFIVKHISMGVLSKLGNHTSENVDVKGSAFRISLNAILPSVLKEMQRINVPSYSLNRTRFLSQYSKRRERKAVSLLKNSFFFRDFAFEMFPFMYTIYLWHVNT
jgi:hypothetical protein